MANAEDREHAVTVTGYKGDLQQLAQEIGRLRYDALACFLQALADEMARQAAADHKRARVQLALKLEGLVKELLAAGMTTHDVWQLCRRHAAAEIARTPEIDC
jgi:hypothetical protein